MSTHTSVHPPRQSQTRAQVGQQPHRVLQGPSLQRQQPALSPCVYVSLHCSACGQVRQALSKLPSGAEIRCPACASFCEFAFLATGVTVRPLPFHEVIRDDKPNTFMYRPVPALAPPAPDRRE